MKIDIEGAELEAFQGMEETFRVCPPGVIICELLPIENTYGRDHIEVLHPALSASNPTLIAEFLHAKGYEMFQIVKTDRKSTRLNSSHVRISYAVFCLKKKKQKQMIWPIHTYTCHQLHSCVLYYRL